MCIQTGNSSFFQSSDLANPAGTDIPGSHARLAGIV